ncbi:SDR family oxidoreductase [bacterium 210820-DFI.6.37]|nr:SDR family oxidoreductase [bacterium 210820-DFI.6.37]
MIKYFFSKKRILITGASSGIGAAISKLLVNADAEVIMVAHNEEKLSTMAGTLGISKYYSIDLSEVSTIAGHIDKIVKENGPLDGFVHSAGIGTVRPIKMCTYDYMRKIMDINFFSFVEIVRCLTKKKNFNNGLSIVGISSVASLEGNQSKTGYCASKAAMDGAIRCLAKELSSKGIRVNSVMPGITKTSIYDQLIDTSSDSDDLKSILQRQYLGICEPDNIASVVGFLLSEEAKYITGSSIAVDSGRLSS